MNVENELWKVREEPTMITKFNKDYAQRCANIIPGATSPFIAMSTYATKPISLKHLDLTEVQCREFWLKYSESNYKDFIRNQFDNLRITIKKGSVN